MNAWQTLGSFPPLAHQGGWDEMLLVLVPLAVIGGALWLANRRVAGQLAHKPPAGPSGLSDDADTGASRPGSGRQDPPGPSGH